MGSFLNRRGIWKATEVRVVKYPFCCAPDCPVVYYNQNGLQTFLEIDLRERVYQNSSDGDVLNGSIFISNLEAVHS